MSKCPEPAKTSTRYIHYFNDSISKESVERLMDNLRDKDSVDLFFATRGGKTIEMSILIHFLNNHPDIDIYLVDELLSCGIEILINFKGNIFITKEFEMIMVHKYDRLEYHTRDVGYDKVKLRELTSDANVRLVESLLTLGFTKKEIELFNSGSDVWWYPEDIKRLDKLTNVKFL